MAGIRKNRLPDGGVAVSHHHQPVNLSLQGGKHLTPLVPGSLEKRGDQTCGVSFPFSEIERIDKGVVGAVQHSLAGHGVGSTHDYQGGGSVRYPLAVPVRDVGVAQHAGKVDQLDRIAVRDQDQVELGGLQPGTQSTKRGKALTLGSVWQKDKIDIPVGQHPSALAVQELVGSGLHHVAKRGEPHDQHFHHLPPNTSHLGCMTDRCLSRRRQSGMCLSKKAWNWGP